MRAKLQPDDALWVIVVGHSHYDGKHSWLNLPGPDIHQTDFAKLISDLSAREQVFFMTTPTSGYYIKPLAAKGRVGRSIFLSPIFPFQQHSVHRKMSDRKMAATTEPNACLASSCD